jgi:hypothetical protein
VWCKEKDGLFSEYNSAMLESSRAVAKLADLAGTSSGPDYELLSREKDRAKERLRLAKSAYEHHITQHGCATVQTQGTRK